MKPRLVLFAREPVAGSVKTRLARGLGEAGAAAAAALYAAFLLDLADALSSPDEWDAVLAHTGDRPGPFLRARFGGWTLEPQGDGDLGQRMARAARPDVPVVILGSDAPELGAAEARAAFAALAEGADVVFAPAPDGGFSLVGLRAGAPAGAVFGSSRWSTPDALADTRAAARAAGCVVHLLPSVADVDVPDDLGPLRARLSERPDRCPSTRRALESIR